MWRSSAKDDRARLPSDSASERKIVCCELPPTRRGQAVGLAEAPVALHGLLPVVMRIALKPSRDGYAERYARGTADRRFCEKVAAHPTLAQRVRLLGA